MPNQRRIVLVVGLLFALITGALWFSGCGGGGSSTPQSGITLSASVNKSPAQAGSVDLFGTVPAGTDHITAELPGGAKVPGTITATPPALPATITPKAVVTPAAASGQWFFRLTLPTGASSVIIHAYSSTDDTVEIGTPLTIAMNNTTATAPPAVPTIAITSPLGTPDGNGLLHVTGTCSTGNAADKIAVWRNGFQPPSETSPLTWMSAAASWSSDIQLYPGSNRILAQAFKYIGSGSATDPNNYVVSAVVATSVTWTAGSPTASITSPTNPPVPVYSDPAGAVNVQVAYAKNAAAGSPAVDKVEVRFYLTGTTPPAFVSSAAASTANSKCVESPASSPVTVPISLATRGVNVIEARSVAGYGISAVSTVNVDFEPPVTAPVITSPASASSTVTSKSLSLAGTISQDATASPVIRLEYQINGAGSWTSLGAPASGTGTNIAWGPASITLATFSNSIAIRGVTATGNGAAATVQVYCNPAPPTPTITSPTSPSATYTSPITLTVTATKNALAGVPDLSDIAYSVDNGTTWSAWIALTGASPYTVNGVALASGANTVVVKTRTGTGGTTATQTESAVSAPLAETYNTPNPAPTLTSPVDGSTSAATAGVTITGSATKGATGGTISKVQYGYGTDASTAPATWTDVPSGSTTTSGTTVNFNLTVKPPSKNNFLYVQSIDSNSHASVTPLTMRHVYWNPPPQTPAITSPTTGAVVNNAALAVTFTGGKATLPADAPAPGSYAYSLNGGTSWSAFAALPAGGSPWTVNVTLTAGSNSVVVKTLAGDSALPAMTTAESAPSAAVAVTYNSPGPAPIVTSPATNSTVITAAAFVNVAGTAAKSTGGSAIDGIRYATGTAAGPTSAWVDISTLATHSFTAGTPASWSAAIPLATAQTWLYFRATANGQSGDITVAPGLHVYWNPPPTVGITGAPTLATDLLVNSYTVAGTSAKANPPTDAYSVTNIQVKLGAAGTVQNITPAGDGSWSANITGLAAGINTIYAQSQSVATGVTTASSGFQTLQVYYNPKPTVAFVSPAAGIITSAAMEVSATQAGGRGISGVEYSLDNGAHWSVLQTTKNLAGNYTFSPTLALGSNTVIVKALSGTTPVQESATVSRTFTYQPPPTILIARLKDDLATVESTDAVIYANIRATLSNTIGVTAVNFTSSPAGTTYDTITLPAAQQNSATPIDVFGRIDLRSLGTSVTIMATSVGNVGSSLGGSFTNATSTTRALYVQDIKGAINSSQTLQVLLDPSNFSSVSSVQVKLIYDHTKVTVNRAGATIGSGAPAGASLTPGAGGGAADDFANFAIGGVNSGTTPPLKAFTGTQVLTMPVTITAATGTRIYASLGTSGIGATLVTDTSNNDLTGLTALVEGMIRSQ